MTGTFTLWEVRSEELRRNLRHLLNSVEREQAHVTIKRYDEPTAVIVPVAWYERAKSLIGDAADEAVASITDADVEGHLCETLDRAGYRPSGEPLEPFPVRHRGVTVDARDNGGRP
jgi:prevent-host-death family protein